MDTKAKIGVVVVGKDGRVLLIKEKLEKKPVALWNIIKGYGVLAFDYNHGYWYPVRSSKFLAILFFLLL